MKAMAPGTVIAGIIEILLTTVGTVYYDYGLRRGVAQPGSVPEWGSGGRWFKSSRPDQNFLNKINLLAIRRSPHNSFQNNDWVRFG